jgi:hypothetical protein
MVKNKRYIPPNSYTELDDHRVTYFYYLYDTSNNEPFYVGKTVKKLKERLGGHLKDVKRSNSHKCNKINKILKNGGNINIALLDELIPDGTPMSGYWPPIEEYWAHQMMAWGFNIIKDGGWGNGGFRRKQTNDEVLMNRKRQAEATGLITYLYNLYNEDFDVFDSISNCERFLSDNNIIGKKTQLRKNQFVGCTHYISDKPMTRQELNYKLHNTKQITLKVVQLSIKNEFIKIYDSARDAVRLYGKVVFSVLDKNKIHKTAYGYKWVYLKDYLDLTMLS